MYPFPQNPKTKNDNAEAIVFMSGRSQGKNSFHPKTVSFNNRLSKVKIGGCLKTLFSVAMIIQLYIKNYNCTYTLLSFGTNAYFLGMDDDKWSKWTKEGLIKNAC